MQNYKLVDAHCHIDFPQFDKDRNEVIERAQKEGVAVVLSSLNPQDFEKCLAICEKHDNVFLTVGISPTEEDAHKIDETIELIKKYGDKIAGIGEVGLDYYWVGEKEKHEAQKKNFARFIELSKELDLPLVVHSRNCEADCIEILKRQGKPAMLHSFSGSVEQAIEAVSFGCIISIPTNIAYSKNKQKIAKEIPLESIVLETDAPYLSPVPKTRNEPTNVRVSAGKIGLLRGIDTSIVEKTTTRNAAGFFRINF